MGYSATISKTESIFFLPAIKEHTMLPPSYKILMYTSALFSILV